MPRRLDHEAAGQVVRRVLLHRNIVIDAETARLVAAAVQAALQAGAPSRPPRRGGVFPQPIASRCFDSGSCRAGRQGTSGSLLLWVLVTMDPSARFGVQALDTAWWVLRRAVSNDTVGWDMASATAEVRPR
jgi:hypothetical protein